jgi:hypothetical protein
MPVGYQVEKDWVTKAGFRAVAVRANSGHLCGYVGLPSGHLLYGKDYTEDQPCLEALYQKAMNSPVGKRGSIAVMCATTGRKAVDIVFDVHGSVTYGSDGKGQYPITVERKLWWFGFDCNHYDDNPLKCNLEYVTAECESLAAQLKEVV